MSTSIDGDNAPLLDDQPAPIGDAAAAARVAEDERATAAAEAAAELARQALLVRKCHAMGGAEEVCVQLFQEFVEDMFMEMQVLEENQRDFTLVARFMTQQLLDSCQMGGFQANGSMEKAVDPSRVAGSKQQALEPNTLAGETAEDASAGLRKKKRNLTNSDHFRAAPLDFLQRLLTSLEKKQTVAHDAFLQFHSARFAIHHLHARGHAGSKASGGDWAIPGSDLGEFLEHFIATSNVTVLPSAVQYVVAANRAMLDKKQKTPVRLTLQQVQICVQKAVFAAEEELKPEEQTQSSPPQEGGSRGHEQVVRDIRAKILQFAGAGGVTPTVIRPNGDGNDGDIPHPCYLEENEPAPPPIDRNAPSILAMKTIAATEQAIARKVMMVMKPAHGENSKWTALQTKVLVRDSNHTEVPIEADMDINVNKAPTRKPSSSGLLQAQQPPPKKKSSALLNGSGKKAIAVEPDAAALSNIFSLGTPRQLNVDELARRSDILAMMEREEMKNARRMATASVAAMSMPISSNLSDTDKSYQAYVAANSSVTVASPQAASMSLFPTQTSSEHPGSSHLIPQRPGKHDGKKSGQDRRELSVQTKFDIEREPPAYIISEGNARVRDELNALEMAMCSPIKRSKARGTRELQPSKPQAVGAGGQSPIKLTEDAHQDLHRPIQTASSHLPQLETSRLAVGVRAVVHGVEKRGPKRSPSRKSCLRLHNYNVRERDQGNDIGRGSDTNSFATSLCLQNDAETAEEAQDAPSASLTMLHPSSPIKSTGSYLPLIPPVSPIKASPHRKHVRFSGKANVKNETYTPPSDTVIAGRRPIPAKQPVWDTKISSPPRVRNRYFTSTGTTKPRRNQSLNLRFETMDDEDGCSDDEGDNLFKVCISFLLGR